VLANAALGREAKVPFVLKFDFETKTSRIYKCTVRGYLSNQKAVCVVTQHDRAGDFPISSDDVDWARAVYECTNDTTMEFGKVLEYEDFIWIESNASKGAQEETFHLVTFDILRFKKFSQKLRNPTRQVISQKQVEDLIGENWNPKLEPTFRSDDYWHSPKEQKPLAPTANTPRSVAESWLEEAQKDNCFGVIYIDIDRFKWHNDSFGHIRGDQALEQISALLQHELADESYRCARIGSDEYIVVVRESKAPSTFNIAESLRAHVEALAIPLRDKSQADYTRFPHLPELLTISLGAMILNNGMHGSVTEILRLASVSIDYAKCAGGNKVISIDLRRRNISA
jgi:diguanylate cyclase (GGDEF)-like protein